MPRPPARAAPSSQPAWPPRLSFSSRKAPVAPPNGPPPAPPKEAGAAGLPFEAAEAVVFPDQRPDRVVVGAGDPGAARGRGEPDEDRPGERDREQRRAREASCRTATRRPRGATQSQASAMPGTTISAAPIFASKPRPTQTAGADQPLRGAVLQRPDEAPERADAAEDEQRVRVVVAGDRDDHRGQRQREAGDGPGRAAEAAARQVVEEPDRGDAHQRLRHQDRRAS